MKTENCDMEGRKMKVMYETARLCIASVGAFIAGLVGGYDAMFSFLLVLVLADIATGFIAAWYNKEVSSKVLRRGLINKIFYIVFIWIGVLADAVVLEVTGSYIEIGDNVFLIRNVIVIYLMLEELVSVLENASNMGIPVPMWLRSVLKQVSNVANTSTPKVLRSWLHEKFGIDIEDDGDEKDGDNNE